MFDLQHILKTDDKFMNQLITVLQNESEGNFKFEK